MQCSWVLLSALTVMIAARPDSAPWNLVTSPATSGTLQPEVLLGASAALVALLLFATSQVVTLEKASQSTNTYLGKNFDTYLFSRSRRVKSLSLPVFHGAIGALFVIPFLFQQLSSSQIAWPSSEGGASLDFSWQLLAIAFWCASFATVAGVLLLNVFVTLRNSMLSFRAPFSIDACTEWENEQNTARVYRELFRAKQDNRTAKMRR